MKEIKQLRITAHIGPIAEEVGRVRLLQREGDGGQFYKAVIWENFETVLESAVRIEERSIRLEFTELGESG